MANIPLKTIKFPGLDDTYTVPQVDSTLAVSGAAADAKATGDEISELNERLQNMQEGYYPFVLIPNSYVETNGVITSFNGWSRTDYIDVTGYKTIATTRTAGTASRFNCFYDENKTFISSFSDGNIDVTKKTEIPANAKYVILSNTTTAMNALTIQLLPKLGDIVSNLDAIVTEISEENSTSINPLTDGVTQYPTNGYIRSNDGALVEHASYKCYYFTMPRTANVWVKNYSGWLQIAVYNGTVFDTDDFVSIKTSSNSNIPTASNPFNIAENMIVAVCVASSNSFNLSIGTGTYSTKVTEKPEIIIRPKYATQFSVEVLDKESGEYITYWFFHPTFNDSMEYGSGQTKTVKTYDVWFNNNINDASGNLIFQGNTNFIHALSETGHIGHVGAGHGCTVMDCFQFFADGKPFNPATFASPIYCTNFRFIIKAKHYLIDDAITTSASHAMPVLDNNGDPIVTSEWVFDGTWTVNNKVEMRNHLEIKRDNLTFRQCHGGMLCGFYPNIDNVMLSGRKGLYWNETAENGGTFTNTDNSDSGVTFNLGQTTSIIADSATLFGEKYVARQDFSQNDPDMYGKDNVLAWMPPNSDNRLKMYLMPCVCTESLALINEGKSVDVFNIGDSIDVNMTRTIEIAPV